MNFSFDYFDRGIDRVGTRCEKWDGAVEGPMPENLLPMWVADMDFPSPPGAQAAVEKRARHATFGYTQITDEDYQALLSFWRRRHGLSLEREQALMLPCVVTGLKACVQALTEPGDGVIVQPPVYGPFYSAITSNGRRVVENPLLPDGRGGYGMNLAQLEEQLKAGARMLLLCSPHNPVSRVWTAQELSDLMALLAAYRAVLVCDEIHADFAFAPHVFTPALALAQGEDSLVISLAAASKTFNLAGLQQAALFTRNQALRGKLCENLDACGVKSGNIFALEATRAAYETGDDWLDGLTAYLIAGKRLVEEELHRQLPSVALSPIQGTYLAWLDLRAFGLSNQEVMERTQRLGLVLTDGTFFGRAAGEGFMRLNFGCPHKHITEGIARLRRALEGV